MSFKLNFCGILAGLISVASGSAALAQEYPARTITMIVPFAVSGPTDVIGRILAAHMSKTLGREVVVENIVGAGGSTATTHVMRATPDGYTIEIGNMGTHAAAVTLYPNLAYDPVADFEPIGLSAGTPILLLARKGFPANDLKSFVAHVRARGDKLTMAHAGVGSVSFTTCLLLNSILGLNPTPVTYNGTGPAMHALLADQVDYMCDQINSVVTQVAGGTIKAYLVASASRNPILPNVPTSREAGLPEFEVTAWNGLFAPKGTPKPILDKLTDALNKALSDETMRDRLLKLGCDVPDEPRRGQEALRTLVKNEVERWRPIITAARAKTTPF